MNPYEFIVIMRNSLEFMRISQEFIRIPVVIASLVGAVTIVAVIGDRLRVWRTRRARSGSIAVGTELHAFVTLPSRRDAPVWPACTPTLPMSVRPGAGLGEVVVISAACELVNTLALAATQYPT